MTSPYALPGVLLLHAIYICTMQVLASVSRSVKRGLSVWKFCKDANSFYAENNFGKRVSCQDLDDMRRFYKRMLQYGFSPMSDQPVSASDE